MNVHARRRLPWLYLARGGWLLLAFVSLLALFVSLPGYLVRQPMGNLGEHLRYQPAPLARLLHGVNLVGGFLVVLLCYGLATLLYKRRPNDGMALFVAYYLLAHALFFGGVLEFLEPMWPDAVAVNSFLFLPLINVPLTITLLAVFPDGQFVPSWTRYLLAGTWLLAPIAAIFTFSTQRVFTPRPPLAFVYLCLTAILVLLAWAQRYRYRHVSDPIQQRQTRWVIYGILVMFVLIVTGSLPWNYALSLPPGTQMPSWVPMTETVWLVSIAVLPITLTVAVLRYHLYDLHVFVNRTLVFGALTLGTLLLYVLVAGGLGALVSSGGAVSSGDAVSREGNIFVSLAATALIAVLFHPMRSRLQRAVNQLMYGDRDEPFEALARLGRRLEGTVSPQMVYPTIIETVAEGLKLPYAAITVKRDERFELVEAYGSSNGETVAYPLLHQGEVVGQLLVGRRGPNERFTTADERLLRGFSRQAGAAVHAVLLMSDLQRSRQALVTAREEERRRLRRDLHDGLGPALASVIWQADSAREMLTSAPHEAQQLLESSIVQAQEALDDIRRLVYGLRPPALDDLGLVGALQQAARQYQQAHITVETAAPLPPLPAAVEVAAYRIAREAIKNAIEHGMALRCAVCLSVSGQLRMRIEDNGQGLPRAMTPGVGLLSMRERAEELGGHFSIRTRAEGGTVLEVYLPLAT